MPGAPTFITFADKDKLGSAPLNKFRDIDANEIKAVVNDHYGWLVTHNTQLTDHESRIVDLETMNASEVIYDDTDTSLGFTNVQGAIEEVVNRVNGKQDASAGLSDIAALSAVNNDFLQYKSGAWSNRTIAQVKTDLNYTKSDVGLSNVPNVDTSNASNISAGTLNDARLSASVTREGNTFNGANQLLKLDAGGKVPQANLPAVAITDTFVVGSQVAMLALSAETGDVAVRTDLNKSFILQGTDPSDIGDWQELLSPTAAVSSVNGYTGVVVLTKSDVGLGSVDNVQQIPMSYLDTDATMAANSDSKVPSQKAVKSFSANYQKVSDASDFRARYVRMIEFIAGVSGEPITTNHSGGTGALIENEAGHIGIFQLSTASSATGRGSLLASINPAIQPFTAGDGAITFESQIRIPTLSDGTDTYSIRLGFQDTATGGVSTDGAYFEYLQTTSANWRFVTANNSTRTTTEGSSPVAVASGSWITLRVDINADATEAKFYVNDTLIATTTTNIPGSGRAFGYGVHILKSVGTAARTVDIDYIYVNKTLTTPR
jgi:hypothetical protein